MKGSPSSMMIITKEQVYSPPLPKSIVPSRAGISTEGSDPSRSRIDGIEERGPVTLNDPKAKTLMALRSTVQVRVGEERTGTGVAMSLVKSTGGTGTGNFKVIIITKSGKIGNP